MCDNRFAGNAIYALPFKGNRWVSGYRLEGIFQYQTGNPVNIVASSDGFNGNSGLIRPNLLQPITRHKQQIAGSANVSYFANPGGLAYGGAVCDLTNVTPACVYQIVGTQANATGATAPSAYTGLGDMQRNRGTGPGFADLDLSGEKQTNLFKGLSLHSARRCVRHFQSPQLRFAVEQCAIRDLRPDYRHALCNQ